MHRMTDQHPDMMREIADRLLFPCAGVQALGSSRDEWLTLNATLSLKVEGRSSNLKAHGIKQTGL